MIVDVGTALDILDACLGSRDADEHSLIRIDEPGDLLRFALAQVDLAPEDLFSSPLIPDKMANADPAAPRVFTLGALIALRAADRAQRLGGCWHCSVDAARSAVIKYLELVPDRPLDEHRNHRGRTSVIHSRCTARTASGSRSGRS